MLKRLLIFAAGCTACLPGILQGQEASDSSTWEQIQNDILNKNCVTCHRTGTSFARQSGLALEEGMAYAQLVEALPRNAAAAADGLVRVSSRGGFAGLVQSFLWEKINAPEQDHFYNDHPHYGALMPLGQPFLTQGELGFIRAWIQAGAPQTGAVAAVGLLADTSRYKPPEFIALEPPEEGFQLHLGPFEVWPTEDREFLYFEPMATREDLYVSGYEISMRPGSHHFIVYNYEKGETVPELEGYRDIRDAQGVHDLAVVIQVGILFPQRFFIGTQTPYINYRFPPGVALRLPAGSGFDLNSHYVKSSEVEVGEVYANIYTVEPSQVEVVAEPGHFNNTDIELPPGEITTLSKPFFFDETHHIIQMWSHAHEHMLEFNIEAVGGERDGELLYWTNDWAHPPLLELDPPLTMHAGEGLKLITTYDNQTERTIRFGLRNSDEMQFAFFISYTGTQERPGTAVLEERESVVPQHFALAPNFPNPFNGSTAIQYALPSKATVELAIYNLAGQKVAVLVQGTREAGVYRVRWDGRSARGQAVSSGVYLYRLRAGGHTETRRLLLLR